MVFRAACRDPEVARWTGFPLDLTRTQASQLLADRVASFDTGASAAFAVVEDSTDRLLGSVSLLWIDWRRSEAQGAYWLAREARGRGFATRALQLLVSWTHDELDLARLQLTADVRNEASHRVALRAGFIRDGVRRASREIHGELIDEYVFTHTRVSVTN